MYMILGSNIPGVFLKWDLYADQVKRMLESDKMKRRGLRNQHELMDQTALADYKCIYYQYDIELAKYY